MFRSILFSALLLSGSLSAGLVAAQTAEVPSVFTAARDACSRLAQKKTTYATEAAGLNDLTAKLNDLARQKESQEQKLASAQAEQERAEAEASAAQDLAAQELDRMSQMIAASRTMLQEAATLAGQPAGTVTTVQVASVATQTSGPKKFQTIAKDLAAKVKVRSGNKRAEQKAMSDAFVQACAMIRLGNVQSKKELQDATSALAKEAIGLNFGIWRAEFLNSLETAIGAESDLTRLAEIWIEVGKGLDL